MICDDCIGVELQKAAEESEKEAAKLCGMCTNPHLPDDPLCGSCRVQQNEDDSYDFCTTCREVHKPGDHSKFEAECGECHHKHQHGRGNKCGYTAQDSGGAWTCPCK